MSITSDHTAAPTGCGPQDVEIPFERMEDGRYRLKVSNASGFYIGALWWELAIGDIQVVEGGYAEDGSIYFFLTAEQFEELESGDPIYVYYGPSPTSRCTSYGRVQ